MVLQIRLLPKELWLSFVFVLCFLFDKYLWTSLNAAKLKPWAWNLATNSTCGRQSKALDKFVNNVLKDFLSSVADFHFSIDTIRHCCVLYPFLKLHWKFTKAFFMKYSICLHINLPNTLKMFLIYSLACKCILRFLSLS